MSYDYETGFRDQGAERERRRILRRLRRLLERMESTGAPTVVQYAKEIRTALRSPPRSK